MTATVVSLAPEIFLITVAVGIYVAAAFSRRREVWAWIALWGILTAAAALVVTRGVGASGSGPVEIDATARYVRWLALGMGGLLVLTVWRPLDALGTPEYVGSLLLAVAGVMLVAVSDDVVLLFLGLELVSIPTYILLYLGRRDSQSQEAASKYFFLSLFASAVLLYGLSFLYGLTGTTDLSRVQGILAGTETAAAGRGWLGRMALVLIFGGLGFKIAAVPFHFYAPDVYQGTTHGNAALLSVVPKAAGLVALIRLVALAMEGVGAYAWPIAVIMAMATMTVGNVIALWQQNLRRLLAYSSIAHAGYMLIGLAVALASSGPDSARWTGIAAVLLYLVVYVVATIGTFAALTSLGRDSGPVEAVEELAGLAWTGGRLRPLLAWALAVFMFSLAGIPPLAGFWGKLAVFASALGVDGTGGARSAWFVTLAVIGVLNAAVAAAYYLRIVGVLFFRMPLATPRIRGGAPAAVTAVVVCVVLTVVIGLVPGLAAPPSDMARPAAGTAVADSLPRGAGGAGDVR